MIKIKILMCIIIFFTFTLSAGNGIISIINKFIETEHNLYEIQDILSSNYKAQSKNIIKKYNELTEKGIKYEKQLNNIIFTNPEFQTIVINYIIDHINPEDLILFQRFIPRTRNLNKNFKLLQNAIYEANIRHRSFNQTFGIVASYGLNLRSGPGTNYKIITAFSRGTRINLLDTSGKWYKVKYRNLIGYSHSKYIDIVNSSNYIEKDGIIIPYIGANVRSGPGINYPKITVLSYATRVKVHFNIGNWYNITTPDNKNGYVYKNLIKIIYSNNSNNNDENHDSSQSTSPESDNIPININKFVRISNKRPTFYVIANENTFPKKGVYNGKYYNGTEKRIIRDKYGNTIAITNGRFYACLCMQGSGILKDGRSVSWVKNFRFMVLKDGVLGITATGYPIIPFHTLAVNKNEMSYGNVYYIPKTHGIRLPNGEIHDGFWFAHDTGGAFINSHNRIDMFVKNMENIKLMEDNNIHNMAPLEIYRVDSTTKKIVYKKYQSVLNNKSIVED